MKFFVDTADVSEIKELAATGLLDGVTTNPSLIAKSGRDFKETIAEICAVVSGPVSAESVNGSVEVGYLRLAEGDHDYEAVNGAITLRMPGTVSGDFDAETVNGDISTDFPLEVRKAKYGPQRSLEGRLGQGGPRVSLETVNGPIELRSGGESVASRIRYQLDQSVQ